MKKIIRYSFFSVLPLSTDLCIYFSMVELLKIEVYVSFVTSFLIWSLVAFMITPFIFQNKINFKKYYLKFLLIETLGVFLGEFIFLYFFYSYLDINYFLSKLLSVWIIFLGSFYLKNNLFKKDRCVE